MRHRSRRVSWRRRTTNMLFEKLESRLAMAFDIQFQTHGDLPEGAANGLELAAQMWESRLRDDIVVRIAFQFEVLIDPVTERSVTASSDPVAKIVWYSDVREALERDVRSADDQLATSWLQEGDVQSELGLATNFPVPVTSRRFFMNTDVADEMVLDADGTYNNTELVVTTANFKALGLNRDAFGDLVDYNALDGSISASSEVLRWGYNPSNLSDCPTGAVNGCTDFVGTIAHEIGHILGFRSGVDFADTWPKAQIDDLQDLAYFSVLDLYRYTEFSIDPNFTGIPNFYGYQDGGYGDLRTAVGGESKVVASYFSLDGGLTELPSFSTGIIHGSQHRQASHWLDRPTGQAIGLMDPSLSIRERRELSIWDLRAMDAIGYDLPPARVELDRATSSDLESSGGQLPRLLVSGELLRDESVEIVVSGGNAIEGTDFQNSISILLPAGNYDGTLATSLALPVVISDDDAVENDETIELQIGDSSLGLRLGDADGDGESRLYHTYTIQDDDTATIEFGSMAQSSEEDNVTVYLPLIIRGNLEISQSIRGVVPGAGTATTFLDYTSPLDTLIPAGNYDGTLATATVFSLTLREEDRVEHDETIDLTLGLTSRGLVIGDANADNATQDTHQFTILNDDSAALEFSSGATSDFEASGGNVPRLKIDGTLDVAQSVEVLSTGGSAVNGSDYTLVTTVLIPAGIYDGSSDSSLPIGLAIVDDANVEFDEIASLGLSNLSFGLTVGDVDGDSATTSTHDYTIVNDDSGTTTIGGTLLVVGTDGDDTVNVNITKGNTQTEIGGTGSTLKGSSTATADIQQVYIVLGAGNDSAHVIVAGKLTIPVLIDGGDGNDHLRATGAAAILWGGSGDDTLISAGNGRSILIGGRGRDRLVGGGSDDILIGGFTAFDNKTVSPNIALRAVLDEWRSDRDYDARVANIRGGTGPWLAENNLSLVAGVTVWEDGDFDRLTGAGGLDWFFAELDEDELSDLHSGREELN